MRDRLLFSLTGVGGWFTLGTQNFNGAGEATCEFTLPAGAAGLTVWFVALRIGEISNFIKTDIK